MMGDPIVPKIGALPYRPTEIWRMYCDNSKARELLGWQPRFSLEEGLEQTIEWYQHEWERRSRFLSSRRPVR